MGTSGSKKSPAQSVRIKRVYDPPAEGDGYRVLVDRLWPRGVSKGAASVDAWFKDLAPSDALRRWFRHDPARWDAFVAQYRDELAAPPACHRLEELVQRARAGVLTLVFAARDQTHNHAVVLREEILRRSR